ncbi:MAG: AmmeMemoRadiSam system protein A [Candidatus Sumerlaeota bacterium]|nr:AmmeMemoRadiSam system protein A [Candidatus Sumerlaeota bacterium]
MSDPHTTPSLSDQERKALLRLARASLRHWLEQGAPLPKDSEEAFCVGEASRAALNVFVSLHRRGALRGCIGTLAADRPLYRAVASCALSAGLHDPRFDPLTTGELADCEIDISVLGPFTRIESVDDIEVGRHGLLVETDYHRGLLLPQVATQYGWDATQFLRQTYVKAGLPPQVHVRDAAVSTFTAWVFSEKDYPELRAEKEF